ncbi:hypothetical protein GCM10010435_72160 [Winogradskya consettensis]|uniref:Uncharacterized protein n=1 Tax=Winogradskya consettensis TaxID=113560 RepID=A0A919W1H0_9ACTN|nr:hypothetical protein [Actinoplanes consettensis]GIM83539.1 hypothetical protein Aco04nite_87060 [Actinoplanes consettensis]
MSYDLAVWDGDRPANDVAAAAKFDKLYDQYVEPDDRVEPTARIAAYVRALLDRYPDIDTDAGEDSPWSTGGLTGGASGPLVYFPMVWSTCDEVVRAFTGFLAGDPTLAVRYSWRPFVVGP